MKFRRGYLGYSTAGAAVFVSVFFWFKREGCHIFSSPAVLTLNPQVRYRNTLQIKNLGPRAWTVSGSLLGHEACGAVCEELFDERFHP